MSVSASSLTVGPHLEASLLTAHLASSILAFLWFLLQQASMDLSPFAPLRESGVGCTDLLRLFKTQIGPLPD